MSFSSSPISGSQLYTSINQSSPWTSIFTDVDTGVLLQYLYNPDLVLQTPLVINNNSSTYSTVRKPRVIVFKA
jgi:hypothetical protein